MTEKPKRVYDAPKHQYLYEWQVGEHLWVSEPVFDSTREYVEALEAENAKLWDSLKALMMGTNVELCADRDASQCQECSMALDEHRCAMSDAISLLGIDMYGEPL